MKKKITALLTLALSTALLLGGCGDSPDTRTANNNSEGFFGKMTDSKVPTLSEVLSTKKVIG